MKKKIFCVSFQRSGTTSCGEFLRRHGYKVAGWDKRRSRDWANKWEIGDLEGIFRSKEFRSFQAFEDSPWWHPGFYRVLFHRFPRSKFILFYRDSDEWFDSMWRHSNGYVIGNTRRHCKVYQRMSEFYDRLDSDKNFLPKESSSDNLLSLDGMREHYKKIYEIHNRGVFDFFEHFDRERLFFCHLRDEMKWEKLGDFLGIEVKDELEVHENKSE